MERVTRICLHPLWRSCVEEIRQLEQERIFCKHDVAHFLDVARIAQIKNLEDCLAIPQELIYAAALLHDIGRHLQYREGTPHEQASAGLAKGILADCGFTQEETAAVLMAIASHRGSPPGGDEPLAALLYWADKKSRACLLCSAWEACDWSDSKKNLHLSI